VGPAAVAVCRFSLDIAPTAVMRPGVNQVVATVVKLTSELPM